VVEYWTPYLRGLGFRAYLVHAASNVEQVDDILYVQANSASYAQRDQKRKIAYLVWATGETL